MTYSLAALSVTWLLLMFTSPVYCAEPASPPEGSGSDAGCPEEGFQSLFDGKTLEGWTPRDNAGYVVRDGTLVSVEGKSENLYTKREFADFVLRFEFKLTPGANNGVGIRAPRRGSPSYQGMEIQVLDHDHPRYENLKPWQAHGSVYGIVPAKRGYLKPVGEWNSEEIRCEGSQIRVTLNGHDIVDADLEDAARDGTIDGRDHPGLRRDSGHIVLCGHRDEVAFRNIRIKELSRPADSD